MKRFALILFASLAMAACGNAPEGNTTIEAPAAETTATETTAATGPMDPVCEMVKDNTWTEYTVHNNDTVWFCSETCKTAFNGNLDKYASKLH
jgi:YHS domain-containing protein